MTSNRSHLAALQELATRHGYAVEYRPIVRVRGWLNPSAKPFALYTYCGGVRGGAHLASFATLDALERNLRARAGL
jgi:hypothetical protein